MIINGYEAKLIHNRRCEGCGVVVGPDTPIKSGYEVRDGEVTGFFHSRGCFQNTAQKYKDVTDKEGVNNE
jgi:hypothetical protein